MIKKTRLKLAAVLSLIGGYLLSLFSGAVPAQAQDRNLKDYDEAVKQRGIKKAVTAIQRPGVGIIVIQSQQGPIAKVRAEQGTPGKSFVYDQASEAAKQRPVATVGGTPGKSFLTDQGEVAAGPATLSLEELVADSGTREQIVQRFEELGIASPTMDDLMVVRLELLSERLQRMEELLE